MVKYWLFLTLFLFLAGIFLWQAIYLPKDFLLTEETIFTIEKGEGSKEIAFNLEKDGLIKWGSFFRAYVFFSGVSKKLQAGTYSLSSSMNIRQVSLKLSKGETAKTMLVIPEGFTAEKIYKKLQNISKANLAELKKYEGYLFPDTYLIPYGIKGEEIIKIMTDNFNNKLTADLKEEIKRQGKKTEDMVTMASLLEKEVKTKEEKELVAGILWKRLRTGMLLQVDSAKETYESKGLPASPISNPGLESIKAAIYPKESPYWYYLSAPDGKTIFSKTLAEHNIAKAKYLK